MAEHIVTYDDVTAELVAGAGTGLFGDVNGPASSTDNAVARFDGTTGKLLQNSVVIVSDAGVVTGIASVDGGVVFNEPGADVDFRVEGDSLTHMLFLDASAATENIALVATAAPNWQSMDRGLFLGDATTAPTGNPASGVFLYSESGELKVRDTSGEITIISNLSGSVVGPASATDNAVARFDGTTGKLIQNGVVISSDTGVLTGIASIDGGLIVNEPGAAVNFRVESDTNANMIFVDGTNNSVGIGTASPTRPLHVVGKIDQTGLGDSIIIGPNAGNNEDLNNRRNVFIGRNAGELITTGANSIAIGFNALSKAVTTGTGNVAIGAASLGSLTSGGGNVAMGVGALSGLTTGSGNTAIGDGTLNAIITGSGNVGIGGNLLASVASGDRSINMGINIGQYAASSSDSIIIGNNISYYQASFANCIISGSNINPLTFAALSDCVGLGSDLEIATDSVVIGSGASDGFFERCVVIGRNAQATATDQLIIDNTNTSTPLLLGNFSTNTLAINGSLSVTTGISQAGGMQHARVTTGSVTAASSALVTITWATAFADTNYTAVASVQDSTTSNLSLQVVHIESKSTTAMTVRVFNSSAGSLTGTINAIAFHD